MRADRDTFIIVLTLAPIAIALLLYSVWSAHGGGPVTLPWGSNLPTIKLPDVPTMHLPFASDIKNMSRRVASNAISMTIAIGVGMLVGILVVGALVDLVRTVVRGHSTPPKDNRPQL